MTADWEPKLEVMLNSEGWQEVVKPALEASIEHVRIQLELPDVQRAEDFQKVADDFMRGQLQAMRWMLNNWGQRLSVVRANRDREASLADAEPQGSPYAAAAEGADFGT